MFGSFGKDVKQLKKNKHSHDHDLQTDAHKNGRQSVSHAPNFSFKAVKQKNKTLFPFFIKCLVRFAVALKLMQKEKQGLKT